ncbi:MAG: nucleotidyltransferase family protein [Lachnospiraceae bacterium]|nr:nucleotidyltransferase family protein [Lachnospiraceae bacterium]
MGKTEANTQSNNDELLLSKDEELFLRLVSAYCHDEKALDEISLSNEEKESIKDLCARHNLSHVFLNKENAYGTVIKYYRLLFASADISKILSENGIGCIVLKGCATSVFYKVPEMRKSGDVDILLEDPGKIDEAVKILYANCFTKSEEQHANHHVVLNGHGINLEIHTMLVEPFDDNFINRYIKDLLGEIKERKIKRIVCGVEIPTLEDDLHAYELILHMLQHYLREGFGIRLLCDWTLFWNREVDEKHKSLYLKLVSESRIKGFSDMVTKCCIEYLGLDEDKVGWMDIEKDLDTSLFIKDILSAGDFGNAEKGRMVSLRGTKPSDYIREFHHQMHLNFPKAGRVFIIWPVLWLITYIRFERNNRNIRKVNASEIFASARERSKIVQSMHIFIR